MAKKTGVELEKVGEPEGLKALDGTRIKGALPEPSPRDIVIARDLTGDMVVSNVSPLTIGTTPYSMFRRVGLSPDQGDYVRKHSESLRKERALDIEPIQLRVAEGRDKIRGKAGKDLDKARKYLEEAEKDLAKIEAEIEAASQKSWAAFVSSRELKVRVTFYASNLKEWLTVDVPMHYRFTTAKEYLAVMARPPKSQEKNMEKNKKGKTAKAVSAAREVNPKTGFKVGTIANELAEKYLEVKKDGRMAAIKALASIVTKQWVKESKKFTPEHAERYAASYVRYFPTRSTELFGEVLPKEKVGKVEAKAKTSAKKPAAKAKPAKKEVTAAS